MGVQRFFVDSGLGLRVVRRVSQVLWVNSSAIVGEYRAFAAVVIILKPDTPNLAVIPTKSNSLF